MVPAEGMFLTIPVPVPFSREGMLGRRVQVVLAMTRVHRERGTGSGRAPSYFGHSLYQQEAL